MIIKVHTAITIKEKDCCHFYGTPCNVVEIHDLSGGPAVYKLKVGRMKTLVI